MRKLTMLLMLALANAFVYAQDDFKNNEIKKPVVQFF